MSAIGLLGPSVVEQTPAEPSIARTRVRWWTRPIRAAVVLVPVMLAVWIAAAQVLVPPAVVPANAPPAVFSAERAMAYLPNIAAEPHTVGSPAQARVREYLLQHIRSLGLEPVTQEATGALSSRTGVYASHLQNVLVRLPGTASTGAVALMAHYDSQPNTPGASDNGSAVAALLETMRALRAGPASRNDVIIAFTDAEEADAAGAEAFFWQHPWARDVRLVVNFEAAGDTGAAVLLATSPGDLSLVESFVKAVPHPLVTSYLTQLGSVMPFGTDMTVFVENGVAGVSPMYGWHYRTQYHSVLDNVNTLDARSVQHQGENALALTRYFGGEDLGRLDRSQNAIAFSLAPGVTVVYPAPLAVPLAILAGLLLLATIAIGFRKGVLSLGGGFAGLGAAFAAVLIAVLVSALVWIGVSRIHPEYWRNIMGAPYAADWYLAGFVALVVAATMTVLLAARRWLSAHDLSIGVAIMWTVLAVLSAISLPGTSYVFTWPAVLLDLVLLAWFIWSNENVVTTWARTVALGIAAGLSVLIVVPVVLWTYLIVGFWLTTMQPDLPFIAISLLFMALLMTLFAPQLELVGRRRKWAAPGITAALAIGFVSAGSLLSGFGPNQPLQNGVWYELDADTGQADWYSYGQQPEDAWTAQFFSGPTERVDLNQVYAATPGNSTPAAAFKGPAPVASLASPVLTVVSDQTTGDARTVQLHVSSARLARGLRLEVTGAPVLSALVNGVSQTNSAWTNGERWFLRYYGLTGEGMNLDLELPASSRNLTFRVTDQSDGLPALPGVSYAQRDGSMAPLQIAQEYMPYPETTSVNRTFHLE